jgi:hypothetical protein
MGTRHLYWILIGSSCAVYLKTSKTVGKVHFLLCIIAALKLFTVTQNIQIRWEQRTETLELCFYVMLVVKGWAPTPAEFSVH